MSSELFKNAVSGLAQKCPPIWFMRQAGRYHGHYQRLREKHSFMDLCKIPELAAEVAFGPVEEFDFDVSIMFSDLLFPLEALGMGLRYEPSPTLDWHLTSDSLSRLTPWREALGALQFQGDVLRATRQRLSPQKSLIGFVGGPWTLYTYAVEGAHKGSLQRAKSEAGLYHNFCEVLLPLLEGNIRIQLENDAEVVMIFDTAAGELGPQLFQKWVVPALDALVSKFPGKLVYYSKGTTEDHLRSVDLNGLLGLGVDHRLDLPRLLKTPHPGLLQGNFDQALLFCTIQELKGHLDLHFRGFQNLTLEERRGWVCGLGHGVLPGTPEINVKFFIDYVRGAFS